MSKSLLYDETELWHGHPDLYMNKLEETLYTQDDSEIGFFREVDLRYSNSTKEKTRKFPFCPGNNVFLKDKYIDFMKNKKPKN